MARSETAVESIVVGSEAELLPELASLPPLTVAVLVTLAAAFEATLTVNVMTG